VRRTKILATIGPASADPLVLEGMVQAGLDAVRLNFSHGTHEAHGAAYARVREAATRAGRPLAVLQDLQGPKIRIGAVRGSGMQVPTGSTLVITTRNVEGADGVVSTVYQALPRDVGPGERMLLDEGRLEVKVREVRGEDVICDVVDGGVLSSHKGLSVPGATLTAAAMTEKDRVDAAFGLSLGVDLVALSFVRRASDVEALRSLMRSWGRVVPIVAKIEKPQAIDNLDEILAAADGVMVARGDLAIEVSLEMIPAHQKLIIERANRAGKLAITATQMLESMTESPLPTRAEVTDVANAVLDGTDAVMLSGETAVGKHPVETIRRMAAIAETAEEKLYPFDRSVRPRTETAPPDLPQVLARLAAQATREVAVKAIVVFTRSGRTARLVSDERPRPPILALSPNPEVVRQLALYWGVRPCLAGELRSATELLTAGREALFQTGLAQAGETAVFLIGSAAGDTENGLEIARL
jgi:pyruvate kinase